MEEKKNKFSDFLSHIDPSGGLLSHWVKKEETSEELNGHFISSLIDLENLE